MSWHTIGGYEVRADDLWTVATAAACSVSCGLVGCFLVLRRLSLLGDAISHAILPGLAIAFMVSGSRSPGPMLVGAMAVGVLTALLSSGLSRWGRVPADSSMGVVFTTLFAVGVILISFAARDVDLDPGCVLYGSVEMTPLDLVPVLGVEMPRALAFLGVVLLVNTAAVVVFYKELKIVCFDPYLATTMGISAAAVHYGLMTLVAATSVASFESVGSILVVAMLVAPGATAHLLTDRLSRMLWIAAGVAALAAVVGYAMAVALDTSVAGMIATVALGQFVLAALASPGQGIIAKQVRRLGLAARICREDALGILFRCQENAGGGLSAREFRSRVGGGGALGRAVVRWMRWVGLVEAGARGEVRLTSRGLEESSRVVRGHRLWESYLASRAGVDPSRVHEPAHRAEHYLSDSMRDRLQDEVKERSDPHGREIP
ncbi:MAG: metal ABC transporter permease [Phycisphaerae bacterium]|nr:metal ABC transporter permease [Phycisphaerae bacterium]